MTQQTYTLNDAKQLLAEEECRKQGHSWDVIEIRTFADPAGTPVAVRCTRCEDSHDVAVKPS